VRPARPDGEDAPQLSDGVWELAENCWVKDPKHRPIASAVCNRLSHLLDTAAFQVLTHETSLSHTPVRRNPLHTLEPPANLIVRRHNDYAPDPTPSRGVVEVSPALALTTRPNLTIRGHTAHIYCATFSPDCKYIVSGGHDCAIWIWEAETGNPVLGPLKIHTGHIYCVAFSPDGRRIALGSDDDTVVVWDSETGKVVAGPFEGHTNMILVCRFLPRWQTNRLRLSGQYNSGMGCTDWALSQRSSEGAHRWCQICRVLQRWHTTSLRVLGQDCRNLERELRQSRPVVFEQAQRCGWFCGVLSRWKENCLSIEGWGSLCMGYDHGSSSVWPFASTCGPCSPCDVHTQ